MGVVQGETLSADTLSKENRIKTNYSCLEEANIQKNKTIKDKVTSQYQKKINCVAIKKEENVDGSYSLNQQVVELYMDNHELGIYRNENIYNYTEEFLYGYRNYPTGVNEDMYIFVGDGSNIKERVFKLYRSSKNTNNFTGTAIEIFLALNRVTLLTLKEIEILKNNVNRRYNVTIKEEVGEIGYCQLDDFSYTKLLQKGAYKENRITKWTNITKQELEMLKGVQSKL